MTIDPGIRVTRRGRPDRLGYTRTWQGNIPHRTLVRWEDGYEQFVDDELLRPVTAEQGVLAL